MTKKTRATATEEKDLLKTKIVDLNTSVEGQMLYARKTLGAGATEEAVVKEAERRADRAVELRAQLEKPLGTAGAPFPMWGPQRKDYDGKITTEHTLSAIASDTHPLMVYSTRAYEEVAALAYCDMPTPTMLQLLKQGLERRAPEERNRTQFMIGDPGFGKSFLGALLGRLRSRDKVEVYDCGGKNMNELLFEMVLDFGAGDALPVALDKRLKAGVLEALSLAELKQLPGGALSTDADGNVKSIDWNYFKGPASPAEVESAFELLKKVSQIEGLDKAGGNALGMNSQYGALVRAFMEGRELVLDEYNKSKEGSDNALQTVWQFFNGEIDYCKVENPLKNKDSVSGPSSFEFRREDMAVGCFVTFTGNKTEDGVTTRSLNKSVYSRLSPETLADPTPADWAHRWCQTATGVPVSTLYNVFQEQADKDPEAFGQWLLNLRRKKAEIEGVPVPEEQETLLLNWKNIVSASQRIAKVYDEWAKMTNIGKLDGAYASLADEVGEEYARKESPDFRKLMQHWKEALPIRAQMEPGDVEQKVNFKQFFKAPKLAEKPEENPCLNLGTRYVDYLERVIYEKTQAVGMPQLYKKLMAAVEEAGLRDITLLAGTHSEQKSVEQCLNISTYDSPDLTKQAEAARKVFCNYLREMDPQIVATDEQIITLDRLRKALEAVAKKDTAASHELFIANRDPESLGFSPLADARVEDGTDYEDRAPDFGLADIVRHDDFMAALAIPTVGKKNLAAIWDTKLRPLVENTTPANDNDTAAPAARASAAVARSREEEEEPLRITENRSTSGLALTTLSLIFTDAAGKDRNVSVHILLNNNTHKTMVVGEKVPSKLIPAFKEAGIMYVDRSDPSAKAQAEKALAVLTRQMPETTKARLRSAFGFRNDVPSETEDQRPLSELLVDGNIQMVYDKFLVKGRKKSGPAL